MSNQHLVIISALLAIIGIQFVAWALTNNRYKYYKSLWQRTYTDLKAAQAIYDASKEGKAQLSVAHKIAACLVVSVLKEAVEQGLKQKQQEQPENACKNCKEQEQRIENLKRELNETFEAYKGEKKKNELLNLDLFQERETSASLRAQLEVATKCDRFGTASDVVQIAEHNTAVHKLNIAESAIKSKNIIIDTMHNEVKELKGKADKLSKDNAHYFATVKRQEKELGELRETLKKQAQNP